MRRPIARPATLSARSRELSLGVLAVSLVSLALAAAPASAENVHVLTQTITGPATSAFQYPIRIAVDNSSGPSAGDLSVSDQGHSRVEKFSASGNFLLMWGKNVNEGTGNPNICTNAGPPTDMCKPGTYENGEGLVPQPGSIAVDSSSGPSAGDVYVIGGEAYWGIQKFDPSGHSISSWGGSPFPGSLDGSTAPNGPFEYLDGVDVDATGHLDVWTWYPPRLFQFAQDGSSPTSFTSPARPTIYGGFAEGGGNFFKLNQSEGFVNSIEMFGPTGTDIGQLDTESVHNNGMEFDESHNDLFTVGTDYYTETSAKLYHFNGSGEIVQADSSTCTPAPFSGCKPTEVFGSEDLSRENAGPTDVAVNEATGTVYVSVPYDAAGGRIKVFKLINVPKVTTGAISNLARDSVQFNGHVDPDGAGEVTTCKFEYGPTTSYGSSIPCVPATTTSETDVSAQLPALTLSSASTYHYRLVAGNANGNRSAKDLTFTTPPAVGGVATGAATNVARLTATINGSFTGDGVDTSYYFEYGPTTSYGSKTADIDQGTGSGAQNVSANLTQLYSYYTYHYRLVTHNKDGKTVGADQMFLTEAPDLPIVENTFASAVDQDSATVNAQVNPGEGLTIYRFEYGVSDSYGARTLVAGPIDPESSNHMASAALSDLTPGTTYHYRVLASNFAGTTVGSDDTFTTPSAPTIASASASAVTRTSATLNAMIGPGLSLTTYHFDYGPTGSYGSTTPESAPIGPDGAIHATSAALSGLASGAVYHFRAVATNPVGTTFGFDQTFTTLPPEAEKQGEGKKQCKKGFVLRHGKCVRKKHRNRHRGNHRHGDRGHG